MKRRTVLQLAALGTLVAGSATLLDACAPAPPPPNIRPSAPTTSAGPYPAYVAAPAGPTPEFPSPGPPYEAGFMHFPASQPRAWTKDPPGAGGTVVALVVTTRPAVPNPLDQNPAWQEINRRLNVNFQFIRPSAADYTTKLATTMAGNDLPDLICFRNGLNGTPNLPQFLEKSMANLTPYLGGDAVHDYPFLAALPTFAWKNTGCAYNDKLYMVPAVNSSLGSGFFRNVGVYDRDIGADYVPRDADDFKRILVQLTRPSEGRWGIGTYQGTAFDVAMFAQVFGAPNNWELQSSGRLVKDYQTSAYKETVGYLRDLYAAGVFHPDSLVMTDNAVEGTAFTAGKFAIIVEGYAGTWQQQWSRGAALTPPLQVMPLKPFGAHAGTQPTAYLNPGASITTGLKQAPPERIKEILRILDWLASPFGSQEDLLLSFGVADVDWTPDREGHPLPTERSNADAAGINWKNIAVHPSVAYAVGLPEFARATVDAERAVFPLAVQDPTQGLVSLTNNGRGVVLARTFNDGLTDIITGRRPLTDYDQLVKDWQAGGGDTIRQEFQTRLATGQ